jgi:hypothetical protein
MTAGVGGGGVRPTTTRDWIPTKENVAVWNLISAPVGLLAAAVFGLVACRGQLPSGFSVDTMEMAIIAVITVALFLWHEAIHGALMAHFGAHPEFGFLKIGGSALGSALFTTTPGFLYTRRQYLLIIVAPTAFLSALGILLCLTPVATVCWLPFTFHSMGCVGDCAIALRTLQEPATTMCEDLRDGVRFVRTA